MISSPPATARLPPGRKSYCTSTTTSASSTLRRIEGRPLLRGRRRRRGRRGFARRGRGWRASQERVAFIEGVLGVGAVAGHDVGNFLDQIGLGLGQGLFGETGIEILLARVVDQLVAAVDETLGLRQLLGRHVRRGIGGRNDQCFATPKLLGDVIADRLGEGARGEKRRREG